MAAQGSNRPSWITVGVLSLFLTASTYAVTVAVKFGKQESDLASAIAKNEELNAGQENLMKAIGEWRKAYEALQAQLQSTQAKLTRLENDRCIPIFNEITELKTWITYPHTYGHNEQDVGNFRDMLSGYQKTLQTCYGASI